MATQSLRNQIDRIKTELDEIKPKPPVKIKVLIEPDISIGGDTLLDFLLEVREAKKSNDKVFVVCFNRTDALAGTTVGLVTYFETDFAAQGAYLQCQPSRDGNKTALEDVFRSLRGNIVGPGNTGGVPSGTSQGVARPG